jgi:hypothetical protein
VIDDLVHGRIAGRAKPSPDLFTVTPDRSAADRGHILALGDTVWGVQAAMRTGISCVAVESRGTDSKEPMKAGALAVYSSCADFLETWGGGPFGALMQSPLLARHSHRDSPVPEPEPEHGRQASRAGRRGLETRSHADLAAIRPLPYRMMTRRR